MKIDKTVVSDALGRTVFWRVYGDHKLKAAYFRLLPDFTAKTYKYYDSEALPPNIDMLCVNITDIIESWVHSEITKNNATALVVERAQAFYDRMLSERITSVQSYAMTMDEFYHQ